MAVFDNLRASLKRGSTLTACIVQLTCVSMLVSVITVLPGCKAKPDPTGAWAGSLDLSALAAATKAPAGAKTNLKLVFHINKSGDTLTGTMDSPDQGANGLALSSVSVKDDKVELAMTQPLQLSFTGTLSPDGASMKGDLKQGFVSLPLTLTKSK
jgi:uncharacterized protein